MPFLKDGSWKNASDLAAGDMGEFEEGDARNQGGGANKSKKSGVD